MALPTSRNTTYVAGVSQVKSADLNALQDYIVKLFSQYRLRFYHNAIWYLGTDIAASSTDAAVSPLYYAQTGTQSTISRHGSLGRGPVLALNQSNLTAAGQKITVCPHYSSHNDAWVNDWDDKVIEWETFITEEVNGTRAECDIHVGMHEDPRTATIRSTSHTTCFFSKEDGDTNWQGIVADGAAQTITDLGVTPAAAGTWQHLKIIFYGLGTIRGAAAGYSIAEFWVDGVLKATVANANVPSGSALSDGFVPFALQVAQTTTKNFAWYVAPIWMSYYDESQAVVRPVPL